MDLCILCGRLPHHFITRFPFHTSYSYPKPHPNKKNNDNALPSSPSAFIKPQVPTDAAILLDFLHALIEL